MELLSFKLGSYNSNLSLELEDGSGWQDGYKIGRRVRCRCRCWTSIGRPARRQLVWQVEVSIIAASQGQRPELWRHKSWIGASNGERRGHLDGWRLWRHQAGRAEMEKLWLKDLKTNKMTGPEVFSYGQCDQTCQNCVTLVKFLKSLLILRGFN